jgi:hypothetical protein
MFSSTTNYLSKNVNLGIALLTIENLLLDGQLILVSVYWFMKMNNFRLPVGITILGIVKMLIAVFVYYMQALFQTREISNTFKHSSPIPSILNSDSFRHDYFFNAQCGFMLFVTLEWFHIRCRKLGALALISCIYLSIIPLILRHDYFMDIATGLCTAHLIHRYINRH